MIKTLGDKTRALRLLLSTKSKGRNLDLLAINMTIFSRLLKSSFRAKNEYT
jgi:hypothetical protein